MLIKDLYHYLDMTLAEDSPGEDREASEIGAFMRRNGFSRLGSLQFFDASKMRESPESPRKRVPA